MATLLETLRSIGSFQANGKSYVVNVDENQFQSCLQFVKSSAAFENRGEDEVKEQIEAVIDSPIDTK